MKRYQGEAALVETVVCLASKDAFLASLKAAGVGAVCTGAVAGGMLLGRFDPVLVTVGLGLVWSGVFISIGMMLRNVVRSFGRIWEEMAEGERVWLVQVLADAKAVISE